MNKVVKLRSTCLVGALIVLASLGAWSAATPPALTWVNRHNGPGNGADVPGFFNSVTMDALGNLYVTGNSSGTGTGTDFLVSKFRPDQTVEWQARYNGTANLNDVARNIHRDASGNVYVTGASLNAAGNQDWATIKYDASGSQLWLAQYAGADGFTDDPYQITTDLSGNVYVTGYSATSPTTGQATTIKYNASGQEQWMARYGDPGSAYIGYGVHVRPNGDVVVMGRSGSDGLLVKYNGSGQLLWDTLYNGPANGVDWFQVPSFAADGSVVVTGYSTVPGSGIDCLTAWYDANGQLIRSRTFAGAATGTDEGRGIVRDASGNVYVAGFTATSGSGADFLLLKYDAAGNLVWSRTYNGPGNGNDQLWYTGLAGAGNRLYLSGVTAGAGSGQDLTTLAYDTSGNFLWDRHYNGTANGNDDGRGVAVGPQGVLAVVGASAGSGSGSDLVTLRYAQADQDFGKPECEMLGTGVDTSNPSAPKTYMRIMVRDIGSGLASVALAPVSKNCVLVPETSWAAGAPGPLYFRAVKINQNSTARVEVVATDVAGNVTIADPVVANLEVKKGARRVTRTFKHIPAFEHYVTLENGEPGLTQAALWVNGRSVLNRTLAGGERVTLDVAAFMRGGQNNQVRISATGPAGATAVLLIGDESLAGSGVVRGSKGRLNLDWSP